MPRTLTRNDAGQRRRNFFLPLVGLTLLALLSAGRVPATGALGAFASCDTPSFKAAPRFAAGTKPWALASADFNGDGINDVAVANRGANDGDTTGSVRILLGDAATLFKQGVTIDAGKNPRAIVAGDFNRDNKQDLAVLVW